MLIGKFRDGLKSKITQYFLLFMCASLVFGVSFFRIVQRIITGKTGQEIAIVNKQGIERSVFMIKKQEIQDQINMLYRQFGAYTPMLLEQQGINPDPEKAALNGLIQEKLVDQATAQFPIHIDHKFVENKIHDPIFMYTHFSSLLPRQFVTKEGRIDMEGYQSFVQSLQKGLFVQEISHLLENQTMMEFVGKSVYLPRFFVDSLLDLQTNEKQYDIYSITLEDVKKETSKKEVEANELQKFYEQENKKNGRYSVAPKRSGSVLTFDAKNFPITINDKELEDYYNKVKQSQFISKQTEIKVREIIFDAVKEKGLKQLYKDAQDVEKLLQEHPEKFEQYVKEYSTGKNAAQGGLSDFFKRGTKEKALEQAAFRLKQDGDVSPIVTLEKGYAIVQRVARKEVEYKPFGSVKQEIYNLLQQRKFSAQFSAQANRMIRLKSDTAEQEYAAFLKEYKAVESSVDPVEKQESGVSARLFSLKKSGDKLAYCADGKGYIVVLKDIIKKADLPLKLIHDTVVQDYHTHHAHKALAKRVENLKQEVGFGKKPSDLLARKTTTSWIKNEKDEQFVALHKDGVSPEILLCEKKGSYVSGVTDKKGYVAVLANTKSVNQEATELKKLKKSINDSVTGLAQQGFIASLYRNATIEILLGQAGNTNPEDNYDYQI